MDLEIKPKIRQFFLKEKLNLEDFLKLINWLNRNLYKDTTPIYLSNLQFHAFYSKNKYKQFEINKKTGGTREILSPNKGLKSIQSTLNIILQSIYKPQISAHGFLHGRSVVTNASKHTNKNYV